MSLHSRSQTRARRTRARSRSPLVIVTSDRQNRGRLIVIPVHQVHTRAGARYSVGGQLFASLRAVQSALVAAGFTIGTGGAQ